MDIKFREDFYSQVFNFMIHLQSCKIKYQQGGLNLVILNLKPF